MSLLTRAGVPGTTSHCLASRVEQQFATRRTSSVAPRRDRDARGSFSLGAGTAGVRRFHMQIDVQLTCTARR